VRLGVFELDCACGDAFIVLRASQRGLLTRGPRAAAQAAAFYGQGCPAPPDFCARPFAPPLGRVVACSWHLGCVCTGRGRVRCPDELAGSQSSLVAVVPQRGGPGEQVQVAPAAWEMDELLAARYLYGKAPSWLCGHGRCPTDGVIRPSFSPKVTAEGALFCSRS